MTAPQHHSSHSSVCLLSGEWRRQFPKVVAFAGRCTTIHITVSGWFSELVIWSFVFVFLSVMICSWSFKSAYNLYKISMFLELECLIKLLYPIRSNINNTKFAVVGTLCRQKKKLCKEGRDRERKTEGRLLKTVQHCKHEFKTPASQWVNHHIGWFRVMWDTFWNFDLCIIFPYEAETIYQNVISLWNPQDVPYVNQNKFFRYCN